jgi:hypothetical protein
MATIRCVKTCRLVVTDGDQEREELFSFGTWHKVDYLEKIDNEYINIIFPDGSAVAGVQRQLFEIGNAPMVDAPKEINDHPLDTPISKAFSWKILDRLEDAVVWNKLPEERDKSDGE